MIENDDELPGNVDLYRRRFAATEPGSVPHSFPTFHVVSFVAGVLIGMVIMALCLT